ncbi:MAG TPA: hypothetical protein VIW25_08065 [Nitrososphaeraceae archaeon]|jgi:hypothetical protein
MASKLADNMIAATKLVNNIMFGSVDAFKKLQCSRQKDNVKETSRISINAAKIFNRYRNAERLAGNGTPNIYAERGEEENRSDSIETKMRKRSKETDQAKLLPKRRCFSHCIRQI